MFETFDRKEKSTGQEFSKERIPRYVSHSVPRQNLFFYSTSVKLRKPFKENEGLGVEDLPTCSSSSKQPPRRSTLAPRKPKMDFSKVHSDIKWNNQSTSQNNLPSQFRDNYPICFKKDSYNEFMITGIMSANKFESLSDEKYP